MAHSAAHDLNPTVTLLQCGFVSQTLSQRPICLTPTRVPASDVSQLVTGGWGSPSYVSAGADAALCSWGHAHQLDSKREVPRGVICAALGWDHAVVATQEGAFVLELSRPAVHPHSIHFGDQAVAAVAAGEAHSMILTVAGEVHTCGANDNGQLGTGLRATRAEPSTIRLAAAQREVQSIAAQPAFSLRFTKARSQEIACGARHCVAVTADGLVFCWGWNLHGQCGLGEIQDSIPEPRLVRALADLKTAQVAAGSGHTLASMADGSAYSWGWNADGQLGHGTRQGRPSPRLIEGRALGTEEDVVTVAAGSRHSLFLTTSGALFACGWNEFGQLGTGTRNSTDTPVLVQSNVVDIAAGYWHTLILADGSASRV